MIYSLFKWHTLLWQRVKYAKERLKVIHNTSGSNPGVLHMRKHMRRGIHTYRCISLCQFESPFKIAYHKSHQVRRHVYGLLKIVAELKSDIILDQVDANAVNRR